LILTCELLEISVEGFNTASESGAVVDRTERFAD
jgi:hypothetical protein